MKQSQSFMFVFCCCISVVAFAQKKIPQEELALHNKPNDCWIAIEGSVYNVTPALKDHLRYDDYALDPWCGKEATQAWKTKDGRKKEHSRKANLMLKKLLIGTLTH